MMCYCDIRVLLSWSDYLNTNVNENRREFWVIDLYLYVVLVFVLPLLNFLYHDKPIQNQSRGVQLALMSALSQIAPALSERFTLMLTLI